MKEININNIFPNPDQPRKVFKQDRLEELAQSISESGLMEPIVVVRRDKRYMIVAGERRWRACKIAGVERIKASVIDADEQKVAELSLLENLQREDLNLIEEARAYQGLLDMGMTQEEIARKMGIKQTWRIQERLNLLKLSPVFQEYFLKDIITPSQAQELSRVEPMYQNILFDKIQEGKANTYNKLRALTNAILFAQEQTSFLPEPSKEEIKIKNKYDRMLEKICGFINRSFNSDDMSVLKSVLDSTVKVNIDRIDDIIAHLNKIKKAMIQSDSTQEVFQQEMEV